MKVHSSHLDKAMMALRYGIGLPRFFLNPLSLAECYALVRRRVEEREANFLAQLRRAVYSNLSSPYYKLLRHAGCNYGDVEGMVRREGLEKTLRKLNDAGVYITIEEYKGRKPVERGRLSFEVQPEDFDSPYVVPLFETISGGTRGRRTRTKWDFDFLTDVSAEYGVQFDALGLYGTPYVLWMPYPRHVFCSAKAGIPLVKWFLPLSSNKNRLGSSYGILAGRLLGHSLPWPEPISGDEAHKVAEWLAQQKPTTSRIALLTTPSSAVRVSLIAREHRLDISGTHFITNGEPLTPAREREIKAAGCMIAAMYSTTETGCFASGCANSTGDDMHLLKGHVALIEQPRPVGTTGLTLNAFRITSVLPAAPKTLVNMEIGDYGRLETRPCGCKFDNFGLTDHLSSIRSYEKLTSEGMTFFAGDLARIMEEILPSRFGGSPVDYQVIEEEGRDGIAHVSLLVSPKIGKIDEAALVKTVLEELTRNGGSSQMMARTWQEAGTLCVRREEPHPTRGGKVFSFQVETV